MDTSLAFVDIETTGMNPMYDRIIEVGIIRIDPDGTVQEYETLIDPDTNIPTQLSQIHGITNDHIKSAPTFRNVVEDIHELLEGAIFAAHNARFDYGFLKQSFKRTGLPFSHPYIDTVKLSRTLYPQFSRHSVDALISRFGFKISNRHRALPDANVLYQFYQQTISDHGAEHVIQTIKQCMSKPMIPATIPLHTIDDLPQSPGVYKMYDAQGNIVYIGKSKNIYTRVLQHFSSDMRISKEQKLSSIVTHIEAIQTAGETGALLLESQLIKQHLPIYNRMLRNSSALNMIIKDSSQLFHTLNIETIKNIHLYAAEDILAVTKSKKAAIQLIQQLCADNQLCQKILKIEHGSGPCFAYHLGKCKGACKQIEPSALHNLRLELAFSKTKIKSWKYDKAVTIKEIDPKTGMVDIFTVNNWLVLNKHSSKDGETFTKEEYTPQFDYDTYKILSRRLNSLSVSSNRNIQPE